MITRILNLELILIENGSDVHSRPVREKSEIGVRFGPTYKSDGYQIAQKHSLTRKRCLNTKT
ncbi:TPA: hypothetical protein RJD83_002666 [Legionella pneumophila]|nr:hypothetical protein [Legionella pneumophila]